MTLPLRELGIRQSKAELIAIHVTHPSAVVVTEGKFLATCVNNATGDYTITINSPALRDLFVVGMTSHVEHLVGAVITVTSSTVRVIWETSAANTDTNCNFDIALLAFYRAEQN